MHLPTLSPRRLTGAAAAAGAAALIPVAALAGAASPAALVAAASTPACATGGLVVWISNVQGAAGTFYYTLNFTNLSGHACTLRGHPGVSTVNLSGSQIGRPARWGNPGNAGHARPRTVRLARGATATAVLAITNAYDFPLRSAAGSQRRGCGSTRRTSSHPGWSPIRSGPARPGRSS
jgi:hypothetical protein